MITQQPIPPQTPLRAAMTRAYRMDETLAITALIQQATLDSAALVRISQLASDLVIATRAHRNNIDTFLHEYDLSSEEGIALMCLAEALLRIPDTATMDRLISDKLSTAAWADHLNHSDSLFVNAVTWSLILTGKTYSPILNNEKNLGAILKRLLSRSSNAITRPMILQTMKIIGKQFVMGTTIQEALERAKKSEQQGYQYSYDMLGEAARTATDAECYFQTYQQAIAAIGHAVHNTTPFNGPGISVKLSALHPRYEFANHRRIMQELVPKLLLLAQQAKAHNIGLTVDAEEADRLDLSLDIIEAVFSDPSLASWEGFGLAVQSYQKRAPFVIDWLADLSKRHQRRIMVRLIKGAYWDTEIKLSQVLGLEGYPVFTRKNSTDISFIACAKKLLASPACFYSQFGTHNAYSIATILELVGTRTDFEFQCLHGMGQPIYDLIINKKIAPCRIYAPVGSHQNLLGYLVRRLLENGANTSFINRLADDSIAIDDILIPPVARIAALASKPHPAIPLPKDIYGPARQSSRGIDLTNLQQLSELKTTMDATTTAQFESGPIIAGKLLKNLPASIVTSPSNTQKIIGQVYKATTDDVTTALNSAALSDWGKTAINERAKILERAADLFEENQPRLMTLLCLEGGKHINDCLSEVRETVDYCRYYAQRAREDLTPKTLTGPTGEFNQLSLHPRGIIACISPWNFPLAIFTGQIVAALVAGNTVIAKPAEQTTLIAAEAIRILHAAGIPVDALHLIPGRGSVVGTQMTSDPKIAGVMFTGSTETAKTIQQTLVSHPDIIVPLIAETGGQNAMIVDSSALPEQVVADVITSAFNSAGQRCSALRVLFLQEEIAPRILSMLSGALAEIKIGDPSQLDTDVGPVIDDAALKMLEEHVNKMMQQAKLLYRVPFAASNTAGHFFAPCVFELNNLQQLPREVFGPILHVIRFKAGQLDNVLQQIVDSGYGLTLGIHSRIDATIKYICERAPVGNIYVNRNMIGAVVGVQPFGGERLSGTGPKAGGPYYLPRLCVERALSINTTAAGGNATLVSLREED